MYALARLTGELIYNFQESLQFIRGESYMPIGVNDWGVIYA